MMHVGLSVLFLTLWVERSVQHGYLADPPQRSSLWRENPNAPVNYNDNQLYCGGRETCALCVTTGPKIVMEEGGMARHTTWFNPPFHLKCLYQNLRYYSGKCGTCGDPYQGPRDNEAGGRYANGIIARKYPSNQRLLPVKVVLTAYHKGYYEFKICPHNNPDVPVSQNCLDENPLQIVEGDWRNKSRYYPVQGGTQSLNLVLPRGMECSQCVLQWRYKTGNSWGTDTDGHGCMGCGNQEEFWNCADIQIGNRYTYKESYYDVGSDEDSDDSDHTGFNKVYKNFFSPFPQNPFGWNEESDDDLYETESLMGPMFRRQDTSNQWSRHIKSNALSEFRDVQKYDNEVQPDPWRRITSQISPRKVKPFTLRNSVTQQDNTIKRQHGRVHSLQTNDVMSNDKMSSANSLNFLGGNVNRNPVEVTPKPVRKTSNFPVIRNSIISPISPLLSLLGGQGSQVHFSFLPENELHHLKFDRK